jgi:hypothetical protein
MKARRSLGGFAAGVVVGALFGSSAIALAAFGYKGWQKFPYEFKQGYIAGFLDMALLARNLDPGGWVDIKYPFVPKVSPTEWYKTVEEVYKDPENQEYLMTTVMQVASHNLKKKYGQIVTPEERTRARMQMQLDAVRHNKEIAAAAAANADSAGTPAPATPPKPVEKPAVKPPATPEASAPAKPAVAKPPRKWCRCDGTDPKKATAERKARAALEEAEEDADTPPSPPPAKTGVVVSPPVVKTVPKPLAPGAAPAPAPPAK